jgi:hypothetical protein
MALKYYIKQAVQLDAKSIVELDGRPVVTRRSLGD